MSNKTILLVEDDEDQTRLAMRALRKHEIADEVDEVVVASDGPEALDFLFGEGEYTGRDMEAMPEFVLLDIQLPKMNGLEVLERFAPMSGRSSCPWSSPARRNTATW